MKRTAIQPIQIGLRWLWSRFVVSFVLLSSAAFADSDADHRLALATQWCSKTIQGWTMVKRVRLSPP
jgi:hypothetical protein